MKPCILHTVPLGRVTEKAMTEMFDLTPIGRKEDRAAFLAAQGERFVGLVTNAVFGADAALMDALPHLQVIVSRGVGFDAIDLDAARRRGVAVSNTPDVLNGCVADCAMGALIAAARRFCAADRFVRRGDWRHGRFPLTCRVHGKKLGIVGMGRIGREVARRAAGFDLDIRYHARTAKPDLPYAFIPSLPDLAQWADFLVVCTVGGAATQGLISAAILTALGPTGFLVNVSRGSVVDEDAVVAALQDGTIAGAALDVFAHEPDVPQALIEAENVVLLPHLGSSTRETLQAMDTLLLDNLRSFFNTGTLVTPVR